MEEQKKMPHHTSSKAEVEVIPVDLGNMARSLSRLYKADGTFIIVQRGHEVQLGAHGISAESSRRLLIDIATQLNNDSAIAD